MNKIGVLQSKRKLFGWGRDLEIVINGEKFYKRKGRDKDLSGFNVGERVNVEYEEIKTRLADWIVDKIIFIGYGIPRDYNEVIAVSKADK